MRNLKRAIKNLEEILNRKRSLFDKIGLGYDNISMTTSSPKEKTQLSTKGDEGRSIKCIEELQEDIISN